MVQRLGRYDGMSKNDWEHLRCDVAMEKDGAYVMDRRNKKCSLLERVGQGRIMLELIKKRKRIWLGQWIRRNCLLKDPPKGMVNEKKVRGRERYQMIDNITVNGLCEDTKRKTENGVEWRMLSLR